MGKQGHGNCFGRCCTDMQQSAHRGAHARTRACNTPISKARLVAYALPSLCASTQAEGLCVKPCLVHCVCSAGEVAQELGVHVVQGRWRRSLACMWCRAGGTGAWHACSAGQVAQVLGMHVVQGRWRKCGVLGAHEVVQVLSMQHREDDTAYSVPKKPLRISQKRAATHDFLMGLTVVQPTSCVSAMVLKVALRSSNQPPMLHQERSSSSADCMHAMCGYACNPISLSIGCQRAPPLAHGSSLPGLRPGQCP